CTPARIRVDRGVARDIHHDRAVTLARRSRERSQQSFGKAEWADQVRSERVFEILAVSITEQRQRYRPEIRSLVNHDIQPSHLPNDLNRYGMNIGFNRDVANNAVRPLVACNSLDGTGSACDESDLCAAPGQLADQREPKPRGPARYRNSNSGKRQQVLGAG